MKEAISIYLGGEIITPDLCDYDSYKQLGLKCPFCHSPVFLRQGTVYEKGDKQINRDACFAHFKADLEQGELCEARAITKAGREEIEAIKRKSRNQRLRLFERHLIDIATANNPSGMFSAWKHKIFQGVPYDIANESKQILRGLARKYLKNFKNTCRKAQLEFNLDELCKTIAISRPSIGIEKAEELRADSAFQTQVSLEVLSFLSNRCSENLLYEILLLFCTIGTSAYSSHTINIRLHQQDELLTDLIICILACCWRKGLESVQANSKGFR